MTISAPPRRPSPADPVDRDELEALIEEARRRARRRRRIYGAVVLVVALIGLAVFAVLGLTAGSERASRVLAAQSGRPGATAGSMIAFTQLLPGPNALSLYVMNADGSGRRRLTRNASNVAPPVWSPDGRKLAFERRLDPRRFGGQCGTDCNVEVYVMNADGSGQRNLTRNPGRDESPAWSPDGGQIAFVSFRDSKGRWRPEVYLMNADGSGQRNLTRNPAADSSPAWSRDGGQIAFVSRRDGNSEIYVMNADGSGQRNLTRNPGSDGNPVWSRDGGKIAFVRRSDDKRPWRRQEIYVMNADGSSMRNLTRNPKADLAPVWSPDGRKIAFISTRDGRPAIYVMNADGSGQRSLTQGVRRLTLGLAWSPG